MSKTIPVRKRPNTMGNQRTSHLKNHANNSLNHHDSIISVTEPAVVQKVVPDSSNKSNVRIKMKNPTEERRATAY